MSIVLPVYNEHEVIEKVVRDFYEKVALKKENTELIVAEDGSTDGTKEILTQLQDELPIRVVMGKDRKGYLRGVRDALMLAKGDLVLFSDTDNTHDPNDVFKLLEKCDEYDLIAGVKVNRNDPTYRIMFSRGYNIGIYLMFGIYLLDTNAGFKLMKRKIIEEIVPKIQYLKYGFSTELVIRAHHAGYKIIGVPITHLSRETGKADQFEINNMPNVVKTQMKGLLKLRRELWG